MSYKKIQRALISVFDKDGLDHVVDFLNQYNVEYFSTGGTYTYLNEHTQNVNSIENLTGYPEIMGGRVKTLHPKIFAGILNRDNNSEDQKDLETYEVPNFDLIIVDLYPFEKTIKNHSVTLQEVIEKIDIGGVSLIRAAAKNYHDVLCIYSQSEYQQLINIVKKNNGGSTLEDRQQLAVRAFEYTHQYDGNITRYLNQTNNSTTTSKPNIKELRYGENPHQKAQFEGNLDEILEQLQGREISYNNLLDIDAAINLILEFPDDENVFGILKHNNACGLAIADKLSMSFAEALDSDPISAFGGILVTNQQLDVETAQLIRPLFVEVLIAKGYTVKALEVLKKKSRLIVLHLKADSPSKIQIRSCLNGLLKQDFNNKIDEKKDLRVVTNLAPNEVQIEDLLFASKVCKHTKSNAIVLAKNRKLLASGMGQTSRIDALVHAIAKAKKQNQKLEGAVMASEAFFPFPDCIEIAHKEGIKAIIQPGGSKKDQLSIDFCNQNKLSMVFTGFRHFKH